ncbi:response regulator [Sphingomonas sp. HMWF008]|nr:response regulator [Sphingomonas sp. HMWF008]
MEVLIVDDYATMRRIVKNLLRDLSITANTTEADSGATGIAQVLSRTFDLIICDSTLGDMTGLQVLQSARATPAQKNTPFVMIMPTKASPADAAAMQTAGKCTVLIKPFTKEQLKAKIDAVYPVG